MMLENAPISTMQQHKSPNEEFHYFTRRCLNKQNKKEERREKIGANLQSECIRGKMVAIATRDSSQIELWKRFIFHAKFSFCTFMQIHTHTTNISTQRAHLTMFKTFLFNNTKRNYLISICRAPNFFCFFYFYCVVLSFFASLSCIHCTCIFDAMFSV